MSEFSFTLRLDAADLSDAQVAALYDALPESTASARDGKAFVELDRDAPTFTDAVVGAIEDIERLPLGLRVVELEPDELVFASEIAQRTSRTKESISLLVEGRRGPGSFPVPVRTVGGHKLWRWRDVAAWFSAYENKEAIERHDAAVAVINGVLVARQSIPRLTGAERSAVWRLVRDAELVPA